MARDIIHEGWTEMPLRAVLKLASGESRPKDTNSRRTDEHAYPVYGGNGILGYTSEHNSTTDDIIIGRVGEYCGVTRYVSGPKWITDNALFAKSVIPEVNREFLALRLSDFDISRLRSKGGQPLISQEPIYAQKFAFPPIGEQKAIVSTISTWDQAIATVEALIDNARAQKKALMQSLLAGKTRLPGFVCEWKHVPLRALLSERRAKGVIVPTNQEGQGVPYIGSTSFLGDFSAYTTSADALLCKPSDILVLWDGEYAGKVATGLSGAVSSTVARYRLKDDAACPDFVTIALEQEAYRIREIREGSGIPHMPGDFEDWFHLSLPPLDEQQAIAETLINASGKVRKLTLQAAALRQEKRALMQQLLTGKRRVKLNQREAA
jgi:type I restriction enzyme S subunit